MARWKYKKHLLWGLLLVLLILISIPVFHLLKTKYRFQSHNQTTAKGYSNDASQLNATQVHQVIDVPADPIQIKKQLIELLQYAETHKIKVSIAGAQHSMGGHTLYPDGIVLNMLPYKHMQLDPNTNILSIGSGALWQDAIAYLDQYGKSVAVMQAFSNFTVGGSISVNGHGWQQNSPPLSSSVVSFTLLNAKGELIQCSRSENAELFKAVIGGYGLFGVILDVKLKVVDNVALGFKSIAMHPDDFAAQYQQHVSANPKVQFAYGRIRISNKHFFEQASLNYFEQTDQKPASLAAQKAGNQELKRVVFRSSVDSEYGKRLRWDLESTLNHVSPLTTFSRNEILDEHSSLIENQDPNSTDLLHEYFVPKAKLAQFIHDIRPILKDSKVDLLNITIREVNQDQDAMLNYAKTDVFGLVLLFNQGKTADQEREMQRITNLLFDATLKNQGSYYLPYRLHISREKMRLAYPQADAFFALKQKYDPAERFNNKFYQHYR
ncbi:FAD/FMN-containing dehydrogenase [Acinetobacter calcoaceticus]|uniref:FAD/FMN-containing dehydrogenase n=1 Tax=Acinetobacter calcoaceticus TaxID=471 RepID=A0A4V2R1M9_ACICA|nr:FAD/FMN-containing dehydrogenase [Acinetobacter calcoaceticus]